MSSIHRHRKMPERVIVSRQHTCSAMFRCLGEGELKIQAHKSEKDVLAELRRLRLLLTFVLLQSWQPSKCVRRPLR